MANKIGDVDEKVIKSAKDFQDGSIGVNKFKDSANVASTATNKLSSSFKTLALSVGNALIFAAISAAISYVIKEINNYINRLDIAKDKLSETTSELESVESEIDSISSKIKDLESSGPLSLTDKEELERLKEENAELEKRKQYLEMQKQEEDKDVVQYAKEKMDYNYGRETSREDIDAYKKYMDNPEEYGGTYYEDDALTIKIAQYEKYKEQRKQAVENEDWESVELIDKNLQQLEESLIADRTELQGFRDDLSLTGESSAELDNVNQKLKFIDDLLLSPGQNLINFIDNEITDEDKDSLVKLAEEGKLTSDVLKKNFSEVDTYLTENGLTLEDLISILGIYKKELNDIPIDKIKSFSEQMSGVESLSVGLDQLDSIMADVINGEEFDYSSILNNDNFNDAFKKYGKEYEDFIQAVTESPKDISKCQQAFDNLATAYVNGSEALKDLTEETREAAILELGQMGIKNAKEVVDSYLQIDRAKKEIENSGYDLANISYEEAYAFMQLSNASDTARNYLFAYYAQKLLINKNGINTVQDCIQLKNLANAAGYTGSALLYLAKIQSLLNKIDNENLVEGTLPYQAAYSKLTEYNNGLQKLLASEMKVADVQVDFGNGTKSLAAAQEKAADATDKVTDALEKEKSKLEDIKAEYDLLYDAIMWFYDKQIEKIDDKIDALNEENERLQEQQENMDRILAAIEANYDAEIKLIQDKIDALKDENDEEERALALEEAKRKLQEAKSRKTLMVYQKGVGFTYQVDTKAITEAEEELEELQENEVVAELEKQIEKLEEAKNKWSEIPEAYEKAMQEIAAMNYFGKNWKDITLNPSDSLLNSFEGKYTGIQSSIDKNEDRIESYEKEKEKIEELKKAWEDAKNAYQYYQYEAKLASFFGSDYEYQLLYNSASWRRKFADEYSSICSQIEALEERIKASSETTASSTEKSADRVAEASNKVRESAKDLKFEIDTDVLTTAKEKLEQLDLKISLGQKGLQGVRDAVAEFISNYEKADDCTTLTKELTDSVEVLKGMYEGTGSSMEGAMSKVTSDISAFKVQSQTLSENLTDVDEKMKSITDSETKAEETVNTELSNTEQTISNLLQKLDELKKALGEIKLATDETEATVDEELLDTSTVVDGVHTKVGEIQSAMTLLLESITPLEGALDTLMEKLTTLDEVTLSGVIGAFGGASGGEGGESKESGTKNQVKGSEGGNGESSDASGLLGAVKAVDEAIGSTENPESLLGKLQNLDDKTLEKIIAQFGLEGKNGESEGENLLSAVNAVSQAIVGGKDDKKASLIANIEKLGSASTIEHVNAVTESFDGLVKKIDSCVSSIISLTSKISSLPSVDVVGHAAKGTKHAKKGLYEVAEEGSEIITDGKSAVVATQPMLMNMRGGEKVYTAEETEEILNGNGLEPYSTYLDKHKYLVPMKTMFGNSFSNENVNQIKLFELIENGFGFPNNFYNEQAYANMIKPLKNFKNLYKSTEQKVEIHIGDIHVHGVQNVNGLADQIINHLPNTMLQKLNKK